VPVVIKRQSAPRRGKWCAPSVRKDWSPGVDRTPGPGFRKPPRAGSAPSSEISPGRPLSHHSRYLEPVSPSRVSVTSGDRLGLLARRKWHQKWHQVVSSHRGRRGDRHRPRRRWHLPPPTPPGRARGEEIRSYSLTRTESGSPAAQEEVIGRDRPRIEVPVPVSDLRQSPFPPTLPRDWSALPCSDRNQTRDVQLGKLAPA
jgi:hypothetical protein